MKVLLFLFVLLENIIKPFNLKTLISVVYASKKMKQKRHVVAKLFINLCMATFG